MTLNNGISRCIGSNCTRKLSCARHTALLDESEEQPYSIGDNYCSIDTGHGSIKWHWSYIILSDDVIFESDT